MTRPYAIPKRLVWEAFQKVKANGGASGVDAESIADFEKKLGDKLYKLWSRMESGSYFPPPVKAVPIPKKSGGMRILGVPTVADRVAQTVVKQVLEPILEPVFDANSYGYRPGRSALDAIAVVRRRSWEYDWVVEFDIKGLFDHIDHNLLLRAVRKHCSTPWVLLYIERWLRAPMETENGERVARDRGRRKAEWSARCSRICSCTTRSMRGSAERCIACDCAAMRTMASSTVAARCRPGWCLINSRRG